MLNSFEDEIVTSFVARVRTVNGFDCFSVKVPITNRFSNGLQKKKKKKKKTIQQAKTKEVKEFKFNHLK